MFRERWNPKSGEAGFGFLARYFLNFLHVEDDIACVAEAALRTGIGAYRQCIHWVASSA
jgi:hypothetical protein